MNNINKDDFQKIIDSNELVLVDFFANWCMPCKRMTPILEKLSQKIEYVSFCKVDVDENEELAKQFNIYSIPTLLFFKDGKHIDTLSGLNTAEKVELFIQKNK